jgi:hypothetical protein
MKVAITVFKNFQPNEKYGSLFPEFYFQPIENETDSKKGSNANKTPHYADVAQLVVQPFHAG